MAGVLTAVYRPLNYQIFVAIRTRVDSLEYFPKVGTDYTW